MARRASRDWLPLAITIFGMAFYSLISLGLGLRRNEVISVAGLSSAEHIVGQTAALLNFRAAAALAVISAFASSTVALFLLLRYLDRPKLKFHLWILGFVIILAVIVNAYTAGGVTMRLIAMVCQDPAEALRPGMAFRFCGSSTVIGPWLEMTSKDHSTLNLRQLLNLPVAAAAACVAYTAFAIAVETRTDEINALREKLIALIMAFGAATLIFITLVDREYARWAFSGGGANSEAQAFIDGMTFYGGATSSALLAMIWLFAVGLMVWRRSDGSGVIEQLFLRESTIFGFLSVIAPIIFSIVERLF